ncbi:hypothetical protein OS175_12830 [Marinicella sp. S1101]|uniref:hypothetical protein n=1 Tax=Marinicella marina TaxID=2996016 RepID=UPI0022608B04|nr:hypothetical protein [Marinicella marina]MCX7554759.1 hypothetical protein [Marinicella marina]MDJ1141425.1 hypothetical protein [Marinicella marina]
MQTRSFRLPFSVADTEEGPIIKWDKYSLLVQFKSFENRACEIVFSEVSHFEFLVEDELDSKIFQYDGAIEIIDSQTINNLVSIGEISKEEISSFHHVVIGFNEIGSYLSVVFKGYATKHA